MPNDRLTQRQRQILDFVRSRCEQQGAPPTRDEICQAFGFRSPYAAECHLRALARKGALDLLTGTARGIRLPDQRESILLPLIGRVAAGAPILASANQEGVLRVDSQLFRTRADYLLRVHGDSMQDAGIRDGDLLAVRQTPEAQTGEIVVARLDDEVTVKTLRREDPWIYLLPANTAYNPICLDLREQELYIDGVAVGVIRDLSPRV